MKIFLSAARLALPVVAFISVVFATPALRAADDLPAVAKPAVNAPVTVTDNGGTWTLDNGIVKATINKRNGRMTSLIFHGVNTMGGGGYWEQTPAGAGDHQPSRSTRRKTAASAPRSPSRA